MLVALLLSPLAAPGAVLAVDSATAAYETPLRAGPEPAASVVATVPVGAALTLAGAPQGSAYPVTFNGTYGWVDAAALTILKDPAAPPASTAAPETIPADAAGAAPQANGFVPWEPTTTVETAQPAPLDPTPPTDAAVDDAGAPAASGPTPTPTGAELIATAVAGAGDDPAAIATAAEANDQPAPAVDPTAPPAATADPAAAPAATAAPTAPPAPAPTEPAPTAVPIDAGAPASPAVGATAAPATPAAEPSPTPVPEPTTAAWGPATAADDLSLFAAPDTGSAVLFYVPAGSTLTRTGTVQGDFVSADFMGILGWAHRDFLAEPAAPAFEAAPTGTPVPVRTPRPGSGVAFATLELPLRAGPSANEPAIGTVPAGARVVLTGVMENNFQRVTYRDLVGWVANDFLSTPADPTPTSAPAPELGLGGGGAANRPPRGDRNPESYSEEEIVRIIYQAADRYGQPRADMLRVARCESNLDPYAVNPSGSYGLFQFIRTTWKSTPYGDRNIFDPHANANAAAWMWSQGRRNEWVCQ